jgi:hypothetical protein
MSRRRSRSGKGGSQQQKKAQPKISAKNYWGRPAEPSAPDLILPSPDPAALVRSLGPPPLAGHDQAAKIFFEAVYEKSVGIAVALSAANDLLDTNDD